MRRSTRNRRQGHLIAWITACVTLAAFAGGIWWLLRAAPGETWGDALAPTPSPTPMAPSVPCAELAVSDEAVWLPNWKGYEVFDPQDIEAFYAGGVRAVYGSLADDAPEIGRIGSNDFTFNIPGEDSWLSGMGAVSVGGRTIQVEHKRFYDADANAVREGWVAWDAVLREAPCTLKRLYLPARARAGATLRYGRRADAPTVQALTGGQMLTLVAQDGEWLFADRSCWDQSEDCAGWIHMDEVEVLARREPVDRIILKGPRVYCWDAPGEGQWGSITPKDCAGGAYKALPCVFDDGEQRWLAVTHDDKLGGLSWIHADEADTGSFPLSEEVALDGVVSATLAQLPHGEGEAASATAVGEPLRTMLERLRGARAAWVVDYPEAPEDRLALTLTYGDGHTLVCGLQDAEHLRVGQVVYDLLPNDERADRLLGRSEWPEYGQRSILSDYFDRNVPFPPDKDPFADW